MDSFKQRRERFEEFLQQLKQDDEKAAVFGERYVCPCCGYPTLSEQAGYEICSLCWWEDDGQDDPHADKVWGGPNHDYSLNEGRRNFQEHLTMYRSSEPRPFQLKPEYVALKRKLMAVFEAMLKATTTNQLAQLKREEQAVEKEYARLVTSSID